MSSRNTPKKPHSTETTSPNVITKQQQQQNQGEDSSHHEVLYRKSEMLQKTVTAESQLDLILKQVATLLREKEELNKKLETKEEELLQSRAHASAASTETEKLTQQLIEKTEQLNAAQTIVAELKERINFLLSHTHSTSSRIHQIFQLLEFQGTQQP